MTGVSQQGVLDSRAANLLIFPAFLCDFAGI
jgi:hypothetical protein